VTPEAIPLPAVLSRDGREPQIGDFPFTRECRAAWEAFHRSKNRVLDLAVANPTESLFVVLTGSAWVFYLAEKDVNDDVRTYGDALHYISTCLSVGYARIYPVTQPGKLLATIVMAIGPSLSSWILEGRLVQRAAREEARPPEGDAVLQRLDAILAELRAARRETEASA